MPAPNLIPGGVPMERVSGLTPDQIRMLHGLWIDTAQELVGLTERQESTRVLLAQALGISRGTLDSLIRAAQNVVPGVRAPRSLAMAAAASGTTYGRGAVPPPPRRRGAAARPYQPLAARGPLPPLPESVSLLSNLPPGRDQGERGTCVAHAVCAQREQLEIMAGATHDIDLSEQYVYWWCKQNDGIPAVHGTYLATGMQCLAATGVPTETTWPYNPHQEASEHQGPPPAGAADGNPAYRTVHTVDFDRSDITGIKTRLLEGKVVAFSIPVFDSWYQSSATMRWGKITMPLPGENNDGGHALAIVGYQDDPGAPGGGYFIVRNSWHPWSYEGVWQPGYGYASYAFLAQQAWEIASAERLATVDLAVRDSAGDAGTRPLAAAAWNSPDVWVRQSADGESEPQIPLAGMANSVYVKITNLGPAYAYNVTVSVLAASLAPQVDPAAWQPVASASDSQVPPGDQLFGPLSWLAPSAPASSVPQYALQVRLDSQADHVGAGLDPRTNNNVAERHLWLLDLAPGGAAQVTFDVATHPLQASEAVTFEIDRHDVPPEVSISPVQLEPFPVPGSTERRQASLTVAASPTAQPGKQYSFVITQLVGLETTGRLTVHATVVAAP